MFVLLTFKWFIWFHGIMESKTRSQLSDQTHQSLINGSSGLISIPDIINYRNCNNMFLTNTCHGQYGFNNLWRNYAILGTRINSRQYILLKNHFHHHRDFLNYNSSFAHTWSTLNINEQRSSGQHLAIQTRITTQLRNVNTYYERPKWNNIITIARTPIVPSFKPCSAMHFSLLNSRSLKNKVSLVHEYIVDRKVDIIALKCLSPQNFLFFRMKI